MGHTPLARKTTTLLAAGALLLGIASFSTLPAFTAAAHAADVTLLTSDFEGTSVAPWVGNNATLALSTDAAHGGAQSLLVSGRAASWANAYVPGTAFSLTMGQSYTVDAWVRLTPGSVGSSVMKITGQSGKPDGTTQYDTIGQATVTADAWTELTGTWPSPAANTDGRVYIEAADLTDGTHASYYIDDATITGPAPTPTVTTVWSLDFNATPCTWSPWQQDGTPTLSCVPDPDDAANQVLQVANRAGDYFGIQAPAGVLVPGTTYDISMRVRLAADAPSPQDVRFVGMPGYHWVSNTSVTSAGWTTITGQYTVDATADPTTTGLYIGSSNAAGPYTYLVDDVLVTTPYVAPPSTAAISTSFDAGSLDGWGPTQGDAPAMPTVALASDAHSAPASACVTNRGATNAGIAFDATGALLAGQTYTFSAWMRFGAGQPTDTVVLSANLPGSTVNEYPNLLPDVGTVTNTGWSQVSGTFTMPNYPTTAKIYFETKYESGNPTRNTSDFCIDDIAFTAPTNAPDLSLEPIKDAVGFPVGAAVSEGQITGQAGLLLAHHFDQVTPENSMKVDQWYAADGTFQMNAVAAETMQFAADNGMRVYGHNLAWYEGHQMPAWWFNVSPTDPTPLTNSPADQAILLQRLEDHIKNVAQALSDQFGLFGSATNPLVAFDVVNEAIADDASPATAGLRDSQWVKILGPDWIEAAFTFADKYFDSPPSQGGFADPAAAAGRPVKLFLNDYSLESNGGKLQRTIDEVNRLVAAGAPIDGVGSQAHLATGMIVPASAVEASLVALSALKTTWGTPLLVAITEMDTPVGAAATPALLTQEGYYYRDLFNAFRDFDGNHPGQLFSVTMWGLDDAQSWLGVSTAPLIFDKDLQAKPAYCGIVGCDLAPLQQSANVFGVGTTTGDISATPAGVASDEWAKLPLIGIASGTGAFQARWAPDALTVYVTVNDAAKAAGDAVSFVLNGTTYTVGRDGTVTGGVPAAVVDSGASYAMVVTLPLSAATKGDTESFDIQIAGASTTLAGWNSGGVMGTLTLMQPLSFVQVPATSATPDATGLIPAGDPAWAGAATVTTGISSSQYKTPSGASGAFKLLWADDTLYVLADVTDASIDSSSANAYEQDSVEIYVDRGNAKPAGYTKDTTQMRIGADGAVTFGTGDATLQQSWLASAVTLTATGYRVNAAITLDGLGGAGTYQGVDVQVNDGTAGTRTAIRNWADPSDKGYQSASQWGVAELMPAPPVVSVPDSSAAVSGAVSPVTGGAARLADGKDAYGLTVTLVAADGTPMPGLADAITLASDPAGATFGEITDNGDGTYTVSLTSSEPQLYAITVSYDGAAIGTPLDVNFIWAEPESASVVAGTDQLVAGGIFLPTETVTAALDGVALDLKAAIPKGDGVVVLRLPTGDLPVGQHTVTLTGSVSGAASATFTVTAAPVTPSPTPAPSGPVAPNGGTSDSANGAGLALALLLTGAAVAALVGRREHQLTAGRRMA